MLCGTVLGAGSNKTHKISPLSLWAFSSVGLTSKHNNITGTMRNLYIQNAMESQGRVWLFPPEKGEHYFKKHFIENMTLKLNVKN